MPTLPDAPVTRTPFARRDLRAVYQVLRRREGAGDCGKFGIGKVASQRIRIGRGCTDELREGTVALGAEPGRNPVARQRLKTALHDDAFAEPALCHAVAGCDDLAAGVGALDPRKRKACARPVALLGRGRTRLARFGGPGFGVGRIPADPRIDVGVVDPCRADADEHLARAGRRHRNGLAIAQLFVAAMAGKLDRRHVSRNGNRRTLHGPIERRQYCDAAFAGQADAGPSHRSLPPGQSLSARPIEADATRIAKSPATNSR
jgi:hypothetical protein